MTTFKLQLAYHDIPNIQAMYNTVFGSPYAKMIQSHNAKEMPGAVSMSTIVGPWGLSHSHSEVAKYPAT